MAFTTSNGRTQTSIADINKAKLAILQAYQSPLLGSPLPAASIQPNVATSPAPGQAVPSAGNPSLPVAPSAPGIVVAIGGPFDPDPHHVLLGAGGPNDPDPAHRQARQADEQRYLEQNGKPWDQAVYVTAASAP